jgi:ribosome-binding protein aMBF1 (putative translation factor)
MRRSLLVKVRSASLILLFGVFQKGVQKSEVASPYRFSKTVFSEINDELVAFLRDARTKAGLTQVEAAKKLGCRQTFISKIECGERRVDVVEFVLMTRAYGIDPGRFLNKLKP